MITKERLEELIEQGVTIFFVGNQYWDNLGEYKVVPHKLTKTRVKDLGGIEEIVSDRRFFETKEEAEWHKEFGCIERTERLELPTWEESKIDLYIEWFDDVEFKYFIHDDTYCLSKGCEIVLELKATKENYTLACRKAKELFLGEKK